MNRLSPRLGVSLLRPPQFGRLLVAGFLVLVGTLSATAQNAVSTVAGTQGTSGFVNATGTAAQFRLTNPSGVAIDATGNVFVADALNNVIRKIDTTGAVTTFAGSASGTAGNGDGTGTGAFFSSPQGLAIDGAGNLYVADTGNNAIRKITSAGVVSTLAGTAGGPNGSVTVSAGYQNGTTALFRQPLGVAVDRGGTGGAARVVYVADTQNNAIRQIDLGNSNTVTTVAGSATGASGFNDASGTTALFSHPDAIVADATNTNVYVADTFNNRIRKIVVSTAAVSTLAGSSTQAYAEGTGAAASFNLPTGIALDASGNVLVSDTLNQVVRSITSGGVTSLYAGAPLQAGNSNGLALTAARFNVPSGIAANATRVVVADTNNQLIRVIAAAASPSISVQPATSVTVNAGATATFSVTASGSPTPSFQWQVSTNSGGSWTNLVNGVGGVSGAQSAQLTIAGTTASLNSTQYHVVVSNGVTPDLTSGVATLTVNSAPVITSSTTTFYATVNQPITGAAITFTGTPAASLSYTGSFPGWAQLNTSTGVISGTPTDVGTSPYNFSVTATNTAGNSSAVAFSIIVQTGPAISSQPASASVNVNQNATFTVVASSSPAISSYQWQRSTDSGGNWNNLTDGGPYSGTTSASLVVSGATITMNGDQFRVVVTNAVGSSTSNAATLSVTQAPLFTSAASAVFVVNQANAFTVQASGYPTPTYGYTGNFPSWAQFNTGTGLLTGTPTDTSGSPYTFTFVATSGGQSTSQTFQLTVSPTSLTPAFTVQPQNQTVGLNQTVTFNATATGNPAPTYQWQRYRSGDSDYVNLSDGGQYSGTTTDTLTITGVTAEMNGDQYRSVATNSLGYATSNSATLTLTVGNVFTTLAGQAGVRGGTDGTGSGALFNSPTAIVVDSTGNAYVADTANHVIRKITSAGVVSTLAGVPGSAGSADGIGSAARFNTPSGIAMDSFGTLYVADAGNDTIRTVTITGIVTTIAGSPGVLGSSDGNGTAARFAYPAGIAVDGAGTIYVADTLNNKIRKIVSGSGTYNVLTLTLTDGASNPVTLSLPNSIAVDSSYNLYVADTRNQVIRKISPSGVTITLAGTVGLPGTTDGTGATARFNQPQGVTVSSSGNVYVADTFNDTIRMITPAGVVTTVAGKAGTPGSADGDSGTVRFNQPYGVALDTSGNLYVADTFNSTIRRSGGVTAPKISSQPQTASVRAGQSATFTVAATGTPTPSYQWQRQAAGSSDWVNLNNDSTYSGVNTATLTVSNVTDAMNGDQFQVLVNNLVDPSATSSAVTLTVLPAIVVPVITTQPVSTVVNQGDAATLSVTATSATSVTYQWYKDGAAINGANGSTLTIGNSGVGTAGVYYVIVTNPSGSTQSTPVTISVNTTPAFLTSPHDQVALAGTAVTFTSTAIGGNLTYQWRRNGTAIAGATGASLTIPSVAASDVAAYDVVVSNTMGSATSSLAQLSMVGSATAPVITAQPAGQVAVAGSTVTLSVAATGVPAPTYQWRKNGTAISGETNPTLTLSSIQGGAAGSYDVVVTNSVNSVTSAGASVHVLPASYAGIYFGTFGNGLGTFAMYVRPDNTGVFLGYIPTSTAPVATVNLTVDDSGQFTFTQSATAAASTASSGEPARAAALTSVSVSGTINSSGLVTGTIAGGASATLAASRSPDVGSTQNVAGFYQAGLTNSGGTLLTIANATGQSYAFVQAGGVTDGGSGTVTSNGNVAVNTGRTTVGELIAPATGLISGGTAGVVNGSFTGASDAAVSLQRLANISTRAQVGTGSNIEIAGFVITGTESKPVLIRAVGPTLANYGLSGFLANPKLDLYRSVGTVSTLIATNTGVNTSANLAAITAAGKRAGAFDLGSSGNDSALLVTLAPGTYTAQVSGGTGIALVEVYDVSAPANGQKLINISTRAFASSDVNTLIAGVVVTGSAPKRVLIRAIGPGLTTYGLTGALAQPVLTLKSNSGATLASNTGWNTSADAATLPATCSSVGAFPLTAGDSAMIVTLNPGSYTAQVTGSGTSSGTALVEIYELP